MIAAFRFPRERFDGRKTREEKKEVWGLGFELFTKKCEKMQKILLSLSRLDELINSFLKKSSQRKKTATFTNERKNNNVRSSHCLGERRRRREEVFRVVARQKNVVVVSVTGATTRAQKRRGSGREICGV